MIHNLGIFLYLTIPVTHTFKTNEIIKMHIAVAQSCSYKMIQYAITKTVIIRSPHKSFHKSHVPETEK